ncbi:MAG: hypothetical protein JNJ47_04190 [Alphaproteobacteria bacterium]|nr:hypothetical protein [Alphaproteobacteria bacterium]
MLYKKRHSLLYIFASFFYFSPIYAENTNNIDLAKDFQNPLSNTTLVPFRNNLNFGFANKNQPQEFLDIAPRIPIKLHQNIKVVTRPILPIYYQVNTRTQKGHIFGIGDLNLQFYFAPTDIGTISAGFGPVCSLPTATNSQLGPRKVSAGPGIVFAATPSNWVLGFYANNLWSFAGSKNQPRVNIFTLEPFAFYNFSDEWYLVSLPQYTAVWTLKNTQRWTIPVGGGGGYTFKVKDQFISALFQTF